MLTIGRRAFPFYLLILLAGFGIQGAAVRAQTFTDTAGGVGLGHTGVSNGAAWADYDGDGDLDLALCSDAAIILYTNNGGAFTAETLASGVFRGATWADYNNDGALDLFVARLTNATNLLFRQNVDGSFSDAAASAGVAGSAASQNAAWGDYDNDGFVDLYVSNNGTDKLYHNNGDGTFTNTAPIAGIDSPFDTRGAAWGDFDNDGDLDLYVVVNWGNQNRFNRLYRNNGDGTFTNIAASAGVDDRTTGYSAAWGDYDNDGDLDLYVARSTITGGGTSKLYRNNNNDTFTDVTSSTGLTVSGQGTGYSTSFQDYNGDGFLDLFITHEDVNQLYANDGDGTFTNVTVAVGVTGNGKNRGASWGDFDGDGDLDLYVADNDGADLLYTNSGLLNGNRRLTVSLVGTKSSRDGIGALVTTHIGATKMIREVDGGSGHMSQPSLPIEFGVGSAATVDSVVVDWPSGIHQVVTDVITDQTITVQEPGPLASFSTQIIEMGTVEFGSNTQTAMHIKNNGSEAFDVTGLVIGTANFTSDVSAPPAKTIAAGESLTVTVTFAPLVRAVVHDTLKITHGAHGSATPVLLNGEGVDTTPPGDPTSLTAVPRELENRLQWTGVSDADLSHYVVYRDNTSGFVPTPGDSVARIDRPDTTYLDRGLVANATYFYLVAAADSTGNKSGFSNEVSATPHDAVTFTEIGAQAGITELSQQTGAAWGDHNGDGFLDLVITSNNDGTRLYTNNQNKTFTSEVISAAHSNQGAAWGDYDNDGDLDVFFAANLGNLEPSFLYRNDGNGTFTEVGAHAGVNVLGSSIGAAWGDYDNDGDLDLFIARTGIGGGGPNMLFRNDGDGTFTEVNVGFGAFSDRSQSGAWGDYDNDGDLDLYVANNSEPVGEPANKLYRNDGNNVFTDISAAAGVEAIGNTSTAPVWADYDNDGDLDLYVANNGQPDLLFRNNGDHTFTDVTDEAGITGSSIGAALADYNGDGYMDIYATRHTNTANVLYRSNGDGTFSNTAVTAGVAGSDNSRGASWGDFDQDGDPDLLVANHDGQPSRLYEHQGLGTWYRWLNVKLEGTKSPRDGTGAVVRVYIGEKMMRRDVSGGEGFRSQPSLPVEFGVGDAATVDSVTVDWPSGEHQNLTDAETNKYHFFLEPGPFLSAPPAFFDVGAVEFGNAGQKVLHIKNGGTEPFDVTAMSITGSVFTLDPVIPPNKTIGGGDSLAVTITFTPVSRATVTDTLRFSHTAYGNDVAVVIQGTGFDTTPPAAAPATFTVKPREAENRLTWIGITEADLAHYRIYRSETQGFNPTSDDSIALVNKPDTTYLDMGLTAGTTYYYRVSAVDSSGNEGPFSAEFSGTPHAAVTFNEIGTAAGISGEVTEQTGIAWGDYNGDGFLDLVITSNNDGTRLYTNNQNKTFASTEISASISNQGIAWGDYDNDGDLDVFFAANFSTTAPSQLFRNDGNGSFTDIAAAAGVNVLGSSLGAAWVDYDNDGDLDLFIARSGFNDGGPNMLFRNNGDHTFTEVNVGFGAFSDRTQTGAWGDFDDDGDLDLYVANSSATGSGIDNKLYRNDGNDTFTDIAAAAGVDAPGDTAVAPVWVDYDNDGDLDLWVSQNGLQDRLFRNDGNETFTNVTTEAGLTGGSVGAAWADYNGDGYLDVYLPRHERHPDQINRLYRNNGDGTFSNVAASAGVAGDDPSRGVSWGDFDNDGDLDLAVASHAGQPSRLYEHQGFVGGYGYLHVNLIGAKSPRDGIGATVRAYIGEKKMRRDVSGGDGFRSQPSLPVEFGIADAATVDSVVVDWPSGEHSVRTSVTTNQTIFIQEPGPFLTLSTGTLDVGDVEYLSSGQAELRIKNTGTEPFDVTGLANSRAFFTMDVTAPPNKTIAAGDSLTVTVTFTPPLRGTSEDTLHITHTAHGSPTPVILKGNGIDTTAPDVPAGLIVQAGGQQVSAFWNSASQLDLSHYILYRSTTAGFNPVAGDSIARINKPDSLFTDSGLTVGTVYHYRVASVDSTGNKSGGSVQASVTPIAPGQFTEIAAPAGVDNNANIRNNTWADFDNDGDLDLFVVNDAKSRLYRNDGDGKFTNVAAEAGVEETKLSIAWGDFDNDGFLDLFLTFANKLFKNDGDGTFTDVTNQADITDNQAKSSASWVDYDNDGHLDLFLLDNRTESTLYHNDGDGTFTDVTEGSGIDVTNTFFGQAVWGDYDNDGDQDLFVGRDAGRPDFLYENKGNGTFTDVAGDVGLSTSLQSTDAAWVDYNNDGDLDLYVVLNDIANRLYRNNGGQFTDVTAQTGMTVIGGNAAWGDYDNDADMDLFINDNTNGNKLYRNEGNGTFIDAATSARVNDTGGIGVWGDYDNDGDLDLYAGRGGAPSTVNLFYRNEGDPTRKWLLMKLDGVLSNKKGFGARIEAFVDNNLQRRDVEDGNNQQGAIPAYFGFGQTNKSKVDSIVIRWPSHAIQTLRDVDMNQILTVTEAGVPVPHGITATPGDSIVDLAWLANIDPTISYVVIYRNTTNGFSPTPNDSVGRVNAPGLTFQDTQLFNGRTQYYRLEAVTNTGARSPFSTQVGATPFEEDAPNPPGNLTADAGDGEVNVHWTPNTEPDLTGYTLYRSVVDGFFPSSDDSIAFITAPDTFFVDTSVTNGTTYHYRVSGVNVFNLTGTPAQQVSAKPTDQTPPATPGSLIARPGNNRVRLFWAANTEVDLFEYILYRSKNAFADTTEADSIASIDPPAQTYTDNSASNDTTYFYRLLAEDFSGNRSDLSAQVSAMPSDPTQRQKVADGGGTLTDPSTGATLEFGSGAVSDTVTVTLTRLEDDDPNADFGGTLGGTLGGIGLAYEVNLTGLGTLIKKVTLSLPYTQADLDLNNVTDPLNLRVYHRSTPSQPWEPLNIVDVDIPNMRLLATVSSFSFFRAATVNETNKPTLDGLTPSADATGVSRSSAIQFNLTDTEAGVDSSTIVLQLDGQTVARSITGNANAFTVTHTPAEPFGYHQRITARITAQDMAGTPNAIDTTFVFNTEEDQMQISFIPTSAAAGVDYPVSARIADGDTVQNVTMRYRAGGEVAWTIGTHTSVQDTFTFTIPGTAVTTRGLELEIVASDLLGKADTSFTLQRVSVESLSSGSAVSVPAASASDTSDAAAAPKYRMISVPLTLDGTPLLKQVLEGWNIDDEKQAKGRSFYWNGADHVDAQDQTVSPGRAFWIISTTPQSQIVTGAGASTPTDPAKTIPVNQGWNQIGVPYNFSVPYDTIHALNTGLDDKLWAWNGSTNAEVTVLEPWKGYWVYSQNAGNITIPALRSGALPKPVPATKSVSGEGSWQIRLTAEAGSMFDGSNYSGVSQDADDRLDPLDIYEPPSFSAGTVVLYFSQTDESGNRSAAFAGDFRSPSDEGQSWDVTVEAGVRNAETRITALDVDQIPEHFMAVLIDLNQYREYDLRADNTISFTTGKTNVRKRYKLVTGTSAYLEDVRKTLVPADFSLEHNYPNPFNPSTTIRFALPEAADVRLTVYNILGQEVAVLIDEPMQAGFHQVIWAGRNQSRRQVASGVYFYRITAGEHRQTRKMLLLK